MCVIEAVFKEQQILLGLVCLKAPIGSLQSLVSEFFIFLPQICDELGVKRPTSVKVFSGKSESLHHTIFSRPLPLWVVFGRK